MSIIFTFRCLSLIVLTIKSLLNTTARRTAITIHKIAIIALCSITLTISTNIHTSNINNPKTPSTKASRIIWPHHEVFVKITCYASQCLIYLYCYDASNRLSTIWWGVEIRWMAFITFSIRAEHIRIGTFNASWNIKWRAWINFNAWWNICTATLYPNADFTLNTRMTIHAARAFLWAR